MSAHSYNVPEPLVDTRVRVYAEGIATLCKQSRSEPVCEGRSIQIEGSPWHQCIAALRSRSVEGPFPESSALAILVKRRTLSVPKALSTWIFDITVDGGVAHARVYSTVPRLDLGPIAVRLTDDVVSVALKVLEATP